MPKNLYRSELGLPSTEAGNFRNSQWSKLRKAVCRIGLLVVMISIVVATPPLTVHDYENSTDLWEDIYVNITAKKLLEDEKENMSSTPRCLITAAILRNNMDENVDPCEDFYQFSCGGWIDRHVIPEEKGYLSVDTLLRDEVLSKLKILVEKPLEDSPPDHMKKLKTVYCSCINITEIENVGEKPLRDTLKSMGGWPVVEGASWNASNFDWIDTLIEFRKKGFTHNVMLEFYVDRDERNNSRNIIFLDQALLGMIDRSRYLKDPKDSVIPIYFRLMVDSAVYLGANQEAAEEELLKSLDFEIALANFSLSRQERSNINALYNKMTVKDLADLVPQINWTKYLNGLSLDNIPDNEEIVVRTPDFLRKLAVLIENTDKRVMANYMIWRLVKESMPLLNKKWRNLRRTLSVAMTGRTKEDPRWMKCVEALTIFFPISLASLYIRNHFKNDSKEEMLEMVKYIHTEFLKIIDEVTWMDETTRQKVKEKANSIKTHIGYPEELLDDIKVSSVYENLTELTSSYFESVLKTKKWAEDAMFVRLREDYKKRDWKTYAKSAEVNAYYSYLDNSIWFPAAVLQGMYFQKERPHYMNFGGIGFYIGHEITHGFDNTGRKFDKDGNIGIDWWGNETDAEFNKLTQCMVHQYSNYTLPEIGMQINGRNTLNENIADNGAVKETFRAYKRWVEDNGPERRLPGLKYTPEQLFWISKANGFCSKSRPESLREHVQSDAHSPNRIRVIGSFSNSPDFARAFNCPEGSPMNPKHKCIVW